MAGHIGRQAVMAGLDERRHESAVVRLPPPHPARIWHHLAHSEQHIARIAVDGAGQQCQLNVSHSKQGHRG